MAVVVDTDAADPRAQVDIECEAGDDETLLPEWLNRIVDEMSSRHMLFSRFAVSIDGQRLREGLGGNRLTGSGTGRR